MSIAEQEVPDLLSKSEIQNIKRLVTEAVSSPIVTSGIIHGRLTMNKKDNGHITIWIYHFEIFRLVAVHRIVRLDKFCFHEDKIDGHDFGVFWNNR